MNTVSDTLKSMRLLSNHTGMIYEAQVETLKNITAILVGKADVQVDSVSRVIILTTNNPQNIEKYTEGVKTLLGNGWTVQVIRNDNRPQKARKPRNRPKSKGKKRP